ncbi:MAG: hypothetical protein U0821_19385 [Chloroflexota bacterium]
MVRPMVRGLNDVARRRLLAAGGLAAVLGLVRSPEPGHAAHQVEDIGIGQINPTSGNSPVSGTVLSTNTAGGAFVVIQSANVDGDALNGYGSDNNSTGAGSGGVVGHGGGLTGGTGGSRSGGEGVHGQGGNGLSFGTGGTGGTFSGGTSTSAPGSGVIATGGQNNSAAPLSVGGAGIVGRGGLGGNGVTRTGIGVLGQSTSAEGVRGESTIGPGTLGVSSNGVGLFAVSHTNWGLYSQSPNYAGVFQGSVYIAGGLKLLGGFLTAVKHPDGSTRAAHSSVTTEPLIEDVGRARLANGAAHVDLEPSFAALAGSSDYDLFLTPYGDCKGLYVASRTATSFDVQELQSGVSTLDFGYRIVAKRRDADRTRLAKLDHLDPLPTVKHTDVPELAPEPPKRNASDSHGAPAQPAAAPPPRR